MRSWLPDLRTLPSRTIGTRSCVASFRTSTFLPLTTRKPEIFMSALMSSSGIPSLKYSFSLSELKLANGSTATDLISADPEAFRLETRCQAVKAPAVATAARPRIFAAAHHRLLVRARLTDLPDCNNANSASISCAV